MLQLLVEGAHGGQLQDDGEGVGADADEGHDVRVPQVDEDVELLRSHSFSGVMILSFLDLQSGGVTRQVVKKV